MTREEMLNRMSSEELTGWYAYYRKEPFGGKIPFWGHAIVAATVANSNRTKKGGTLAKPEDFMPEFKPAEENSIDDLVNFAAQLTMMMGGEDKRNEPTA